MRDRAAALLDRPVGGASYAIPMAYDAYLALGESMHCEYYDGLCIMNPPARRHSRAQLRVSDWLRAACPSTHEVLIGWGWQLPGQGDFEPDIMVSDRSTPDEEILRTPPPLLVVEITSPSTRDRDWGTKRAHYARGRARWYWIVDLADLAEPEIVAFENHGGSFVERRHIVAPATAVGPFPASVDPATLLEP